MNEREGRVPESSVPETAVEALVSAKVQEGELVISEGAAAAVAEPAASDLIFTLESKPPFGVTLLAATQHILAIILSVMTPPAIVGAALGLPVDVIAYLISMSLLISGIGIWIQVGRPFGIGSGMLSIQATSFVFPGTLITVGRHFMQHQGMSWEEALATLFGICFVGGFVVAMGSFFVKYLQKVITHTVAGVTVMMIGLSLIRVGAVDIGGGKGALQDGSFGDPINLSLGLLTIAVIILCNRSKSPILRMSALVLGMLVGFLVAIPLDKVDWSVISSNASWFTYPVPFKFGFFGFDFAAFMIFFFLFLTVIIEAIGDLTATSSVSEQPVDGPVYQSRLRGGLLCDGIMTMLGAVVGCFPAATFSQNNGIIQLSGVASRKVGKYIGVLFLLFATFPVIVIFFRLLPRPVLGGALLILFGTIACAGIRIFDTVNRRESIIIAAGLSVGVMSMIMPEAFAKLPHLMQVFFDSAIVSGGVTAILVHLALPKSVAIGKRPKDKLIS